MSHPAAQPPRPVMLVIFDGFGSRKDPRNNAVKMAKMPNFDRFWDENPHAHLVACGEDVGLPRGQMGNSEVGHLNIGAGRIVMQDLPKISKAAQDGSLADRPALKRFIAALRKSGGTCHLLGLVSPGGVHAHQKHIEALATIVASAGVPVCVHIFTDGRDTPPRSGQEFVESFLRHLPKDAHLGTISGRYYAMDRDKRWERVQLAYDAIVSGNGPHMHDPNHLLSEAYAKGVTDEFIVPTVNEGYSGMRDGDGILSANFRADRIRQLMEALLEPNFEGFERGRVVRFSASCAMAPYSQELNEKLDIIFDKEPLNDLLGDVVARANKRQLRMAETEKYPHVTYFLNGGREDVLPGEERILIPSPKVATYDLQPEMSAKELCDKAVTAINSGKFDLIVLNFANPDMVGHTGVLSAAIKACENLDSCLGDIVAAIASAGGALMVTADHGNCETMVDPDTGGAHTAHTLNPVPVVLKCPSVSSIHDGRLEDIAPTLLQLMGLPQPNAMTGTSLIDV